MVHVTMRNGDRSIWTHMWEQGTHTVYKIFSERCWDGTVHIRDGPTSSEIGKGVYYSLFRTQLGSVTAMVWGVATPNAVESTAEVVILLKCLVRWHITHCRLLRVLHTPVMPTWLNTVDADLKAGVLWHRVFDVANLIEKSWCSFSFIQKYASLCQMCSQLTGHCFKDMFTVRLFCWVDIQFLFLVGAWSFVE